ncbi:MAG: rRNA adenine N-6-methyltransferase family protein [Nanoarchaeota archaeon]|nr:rRNA adenine N-6-methyltransferase family protein [Nanoarchaeota archaeon]
MLDQHFMIDRDVLVRIVGIADLNKTDTVLEIGGGQGALTEYLVKIANIVYVVEKDITLIPILQEKFGHRKNAVFIFNDVMDVKLPKFDKCVSNLPYTICEPLMWMFTRHEFERLVFVVPKRFVDLLTGERNSRLKLFMDSFYNLEVFDDISPESFEPPPKVMSTIIRLTPKKEGNMFLREFFSQYDKKTKNALRDMYIKTGLNKREALDKVNLMMIRPMILGKKITNLSLAEIEAVVRAFSESKA